MKAPGPSLFVEILSNGRTAKLIKPLVISIGFRLYLVPIGFVTDFASVPKMFWRFIPPWGAYSRATVVHDYLYRTGCVSRKEADRALFRIMELHDVSFLTKWTIYLGARLFGSAYFKRRAAAKLACKGKKSCH
jgi:hypothetical protein